MHHLLKRDLGLAFSVSATSRAKRAYEVDGKDYFFITAEEFKRRIEADAFVEWEEVYAGQFYGTLKSQIDRIWTEGHAPVFDVDVEGGLNLKHIFGKEALALFIAPPSIQVLEQRLKSRGTETEESLAKRVAKAEMEIGYASRFDAIVVNDELERACAEAADRVIKFLGA